MPNLYLGQWEWFTTPSPRWRAPGGDAIGCLDLRNESQMSQAGGVSQGYGLFVYPGPKVHPLLTLPLGDDITRQTTVVERSGLEVSLGLTPGAILERRADRIIRELFLSHANVDGVTHWKPARISRLAGCHIHLGGFGAIVAEPFSESHPGFQKTIDVFQVDYRRMRGVGPVTEVHKRYTGAQMLKLWGRLGDDLIPGLLPPEHLGDGWAVPATTITENFNKADSSTLGPNLTWTETSGDWTVASNQVRIADATPDYRTARAESALSSDDHYAQLKIVALGVGSGIGGAVRFAAAANTCYISFIWQSDSNLYLAKVVAGTGTDLAWAAVTQSLPETYKIQSDSADLLAGYQAGVLRVSVTDTSITGNVRAGLGAYTQAATDGDDFEAADLAAETGQPTMRRWGGIHNMPRTSRQRRGW